MLVVDAGGAVVEVDALVVLVVLVDVDEVLVEVLDVEVVCAAAGIAQDTDRRTGRSAAA